MHTKQSSTRVHSTKLIPHILLLFFAAFVCMTRGSYDWFKLGTSQPYASPHYTIIIMLWRVCLAACDCCADVHYDQLDHEHRVQRMQHVVGQTVIERGSQFGNTHTQTHICCVCVVDSLSHTQTCAHMLSPAECIPSRLGPTAVVQEPHHIYVGFEALRLPASTSESNSIKNRV